MKALIIELGKQIDVELIAENDEDRERLQMVWHSKTKGFSVSCEEWREIMARRKR